MESKADGCVGGHSRAIRSSLDLDGRRLSYIDYGGPGRPLLALHGHFGEGMTFARLASALGPSWRVIAPDQRGHGESDRADGYSRGGYLRDVTALLNHLDITKVAIVGHSLGGVNAYWLAATYPDLVIAMVIEDIGAVVDDDLTFSLDWPTRAKSREDLISALGRLSPHLADAFREFSDGWGFAFQAEDMVLSQRALNGDHWAAWLASDCPALVMRGSRSLVLSAGHAAAMVSRRPNTRMVEIAAGHVIHDDQPRAFAAAIRRFLDSLV